MSVGHSTEETELYCQPSDVARFIKPRDPTLSPDEDRPVDFRDEDSGQGATTPSRSQVIKHIEGASARIDRKTQQSWRANTVTHETHDHGGIYYWLSGHPVKLQKKNIRPIDPSKGDKIEVWTGNKWEDFAAKSSYTAGRDGDYWIDGPLGILWIYERAILRPHPKFRITYRYGYDQVPHDIREAVAKRAAADIASGDFYGTTVPGNNQGDNSDPSKVAEVWKEDFKEVCRDYKKLSWV